MAAPQFCASLSIPVRDSFGFSSATMAAPAISRLPIGTAFVMGSSPLLIQATARSLRPASRAKSTISIRCAQGGNGVGVLLGRTAMVGFAVSVTTEFATGKGLLENLGLIAPLPTLALAGTGLAGIVAAILIFQSASENDFS